MNLATVVSLAIETFTIVDVPFWGMYTWIALVVVVLLFAGWIVMGVLDDELPLAIVTGVIFLGAAFPFGVYAPSSTGVSEEQDRLVLEQLTELGYSNIDYNSGDFTASDSDGQYVRGLVEWDQNKYQVLLFGK